MSSPDTENLLRVWSRVTEGAAGAAGDNVSAPEDSAAAYLRQTMDSLAGAAASYSRMAASTRDPAARRTLLDLAARERRLERRLQAEHFLLTGDTYAPARPRIPDRSLLAAIRDLHARELELSRALETAPLPVLRDQSAAHARHAQALLRLTQRLIT